MAARNIKNKKQHEGIIYAILCPDTKKVMYVGQTTNLARRKYQHLKSKPVGTKITEWIHELRLVSKAPCFQILERTNQLRLDEREIYWIKQYKNKQLLNMTNGGNYQISAIDTMYRNPKSGQPPSLTWVRCAKNIGCDPDKLMEAYAFIKQLSEYDRFCYEVYLSSIIPIPVRVSKWISNCAFLHLKTDTDLDNCANTIKRILSHA